MGRYHFNAETLKKIITRHSFSITLNANDFFMWATAYGVDVDVCDLWKLIEVYEKFGVEGFEAFLSKYEGVEPMEEYCKSPTYMDAEEYLKDFIKFENEPIKKHKKKKCIKR